MTVISKDQILKTNSTSYVDMLGILVGMERLAGETADRFAERIDLAISAQRGSDYVGLMNNLSLAFGLEMYPLVQISSDQDFDIRVVFGSMIVLVGGVSTVIPLLHLSVDNFWEWRKISEVLADLASLRGLQVESRSRQDGPALQLVRQSNTVLVVGEVLAGAKIEQLMHGRLIPETISFSLPVPAYTVSNDGRTLQFSTPCAAGITVSYQYRTRPYLLVASPVSLLSLTDPNVTGLSMGTNGTVIYQVREYLQEILQRDRSYWGK